MIRFKRRDTFEAALGVLREFHPRVFRIQATRYLIFDDEATAKEALRLLNDLITRRR
jgi:hypothetical protein